MCEQLTVLRKIRAAGKMNGFSVDLAEAQAKDYMSLKKDVDVIKSDMNDIKTEQARQGGKIDAIFQYINSPADAERKDGILWREIKKMITSKQTWILVIFFLFCVAMAGDKVAKLLGWIPSGV